MLERVFHRALAQRLCELCIPNLEFFGVELIIGQTVTINPRTSSQIDPGVT
jgi:hypothetical protein